LIARLGGLRVEVIRSVSPSMAGQLTASPSGRPPAGPAHRPRRWARPVLPGEPGWSWVLSCAWPRCVRLTYRRGPEQPRDHRRTARRPLL